MNDMGFADLLLDSYQQAAGETSQFGPGEGLHDYLFGLYGETGQLLSVVKKTHRDRRQPYALEVQEELGDALWYLSQCAKVTSVPMSELGQTVVDRLVDSLHLEPRSNPQEQPLSFVSIDGLLAFARTKITPDLNQALNSLAAAVGGLVGDYVKDHTLLPGESRRHLGEVFYWLAMVSGTVRISLTDAAMSNLAKNRSRWPGAPLTYLPFFDEELADEEQLLRRLEVDFDEKTVGGRVFVFQRCRGINIGDRLTDNRVEKDDYRFHDVFHMANAVHLGWSPVMRALLRVKRKSDADLDENQDGARAIIIEEAITAWIFNHAKSNNLYAGIQIGKLDYSLLKQIQKHVEGYEVAKCPLWQWERAILDGYAAFRFLKDKRRGRIIADLDHRVLKVEPLPAPRT